MKLVEPPCVMDTLRFVECRGMREALAGVPLNHSGKGLHLAFGVIQEAGARRLLGVAHRARRGASPVLLNVCPWCGARLLRPDVYDAGEPAKEASAQAGPIGTLTPIRAPPSTVQEDPG